MHLFQKQSKQLLDTWKEITSMEHIDHIIQKSFDLTQVIFKHSISCGISWGAKHRLESQWDIQDELEFHYLDLLNYRPISNAIADQLGIVHQSPQLIVVKDGQAIDKVSHHEIQIDWLNQYKK